MLTTTNATIAILGISDNPDRYSHKAAMMLRSKGYQNLIGISPGKSSVPGVTHFNHLEEIDRPIDTLTIYVNPTITASLTSAILALKPRRIIMNPGAEHDGLAAEATKAGIEVLEACTLVMLSSAQF